MRVRVAATGVPPLPDEEMHVGAWGAGFRIRGVAAYAIRGGTEIVVEPEPGAPERNHRLYLLGSAMGVLLHQRGLLPLHANAVEIAGRAHAFMGPPGIGKSTLAAAMKRAGCPVLTDDVCVVGADGGGGFVAQPGIPRLRLWRNSLEALGLRREECRRSYAGDEAYDKYDVTLSRAAAGPIPLGGVFLLEDGDKLTIEPIGGVEAVAALVENTYRGAYAALTGGTEEHWRQCNELAGTVPTYRLRRPRCLCELRGSIAVILELCRSLRDPGDCQRPSPALSPSSEQDLA